MSRPTALAALVEALTAVPEYQNPLTPLYDALGQEAANGPLTLRTIRRHAQVLYALSGQANDQAAAVTQVIVSCKQLLPTPLPVLPLGF
ncbi:MAG: hypothetical protein KBE23_24955 [Chloroflexi bacterium]|nr:hypothetical protein [Chloroflexota bacterium]